MKKLTSLFLCFILALGVISPANVLAADDFLCYLTYSDIQAYSGSPDLRWSNNSNSVATQQISTVYLAKNEYEGFQIFYYEKGNEKDLKIIVDEFVNDSGEILKHSIYNEMYIECLGNSLADALIPYSGETVKTKTNDNNMFYVELHSEKEQTPGTYRSVVTLYDGDAVLIQKPISAIVWNFALPEGHYATTFMGLYNAASGYSSSRGFLELSGVRFQNGEIIEEDIAKAEEILEGWDEFLLRHGVNSYELPRFMIDADPKKAQTAMADPRRSAFCVPLLSGVSNGSFSENAEAKILQYKELAYSNKFIADKALFYTKDEPTWSNDEQVAHHISLCNAIEQLWPDFHSVIPFFSPKDYDYQIEKIRETSDIFCVNQSTVAASSAVLEDFTDGSWHRTWRYQGDVTLGGTYMHRWGKSPMGVFTRIQYWQADLLNSNGILHWNVGYCPIKNDSTPYDVLKEGAINPAMGSSTGNGDGILAYPSANLGFDAATPIASLRLKHVANGMDDYDYLQLAREFLGEDSKIYQEAINKVFNQYKNHGLQHIFSSERSPFDSSVSIEWTSWECVSMNNARIALGNALSEADTEHKFGEWETAVVKDDDHNGLEIRTCSDCGTQESRRDYVCSEENTDHSYNYKAIDKTSHALQCVYCEDIKSTEAHTSVSVPAVYPSCTQNGYTEHTKCSVCDEFLTYPQTTKAIGHFFDDNWTETKAPNCTFKGIESRTCTRDNCEETQNRETVLGDHVWDEGKEVYYLGCTNPGYMLYICDICNQYDDTEEIPALPDHDVKAWVRLADPTCSRKGEEAGRCEKCDKFVTIILDKLPHSTYSEISDPPTCTVYGVVHNFCYNCTFSEIAEYLPPTGHSDADLDDYCEKCGKYLKEECTHICHETGFLGFIWKIIRFFTKLFGIEPACSCGERHY